jgi:tRNA nucleotidyltransferase (CCA-adding enzyme)
MKLRRVSSMQKPKAIHEEVLKKIIPTQSERSKIHAIAKKLQQRVLRLSKEQDVEATVRVEGSIAKDTWLRKEPEIDIFLRLPTTIPRESLGEISLRIARKATEGAKQVERYAEHPYLEAFFDNVRLNIVPCYDVKRGKWRSATDRTPFHTDYVKKHLSQGLSDEIRLLKKFLQGIKVYGAEIKIGGFSGYLCELLILNYKSFIETLREFSKQTKQIVIDIENYYGNKEKELKLLFSEPLVTIDPVDKARNVASAVQAQKLYTFIAAARAYLKTPSRKFFFPPKGKTLTLEALKNRMAARGASLVFLKLNKIEAVSDILWGQLYKTKRALRKLAKLYDFKVLRDDVWSNERTINVFTFELEQQVLPSIKKHLGPPLKHERECEKFLSKYSNNLGVVSGPYLEDDRWVVELRRNFTDFSELLREKLRGGGRNVGVAEFIAQAFQEKLEVLADSQVVETYEGNQDFAEFLSGFLYGKPFWLEAES